MTKILDEVLASNAICREFGAKESCLRAAISRS